MALADLKGKITDDANARAKEITEDGKKRAQSIQHETSTQIQAIRDEFEAQLAKEVDHAKSNVFHLVDQKVKMLGENKKRAVIDKVFSETLAQLEAMNDAEFEKFMGNLLSNLNISDKKARVVVLPKRAKAVESLLGKQSLNLSIEENKNALDGCLIASDTFEFDLTFKRIMQDMHNKHEADIASILFTAN